MRKAATRDLLDKDLAFEELRMHWGRRGSRVNLFEMEIKHGHIYAPQLPNWAWLENRATVWGVNSFNQNDELTEHKLFTYFIQAEEYFEAKAIG